uniref:Ribosomal protein/NADH dehydrogenase domain-containing protein n=1 Tax=Rhodosorus marinus TaxID=101924 RepID=A0A7S0G3A6_9RHOD|mmetsp:Transcript_15209/g.22362  ORF Transcript_15209/g.22362 Transcript_15209/m.22362 type:complete len:118 (+) Transcript_15209:141-494(+)
MSWKARLSVALNELRVVYCTKSGSSEGTRDFLKKYYSELKTLNPGLPIYVRPCDGADAKVLARYERGVYAAHDVQGKSAEGILAIVKDLAEQATDVNARLSTKYGTKADLRIPEVVQ